MAAGRAANQEEGARCAWKIRWLGQIIQTLLYKA